MEAASRQKSKRPPSHRPTTWSRPSSWPCLPVTILLFCAARATRLASLWWKCITYPDPRDVVLMYFRNSDGATAGDIHAVAEAGFDDNHRRRIDLREVGVVVLRLGPALAVLER